MIALHMLEVRDCMSKLLLSDIFDAFLFIEGDITTFNTFHLDGYLKKDFFDTEEALSRFSSREYSLWKEVRTLCYTIIKGKKTPLGFKFVFCLSGENTSRLLVQEGLSFSPEDVRGLYLNLSFDGSTLHCVTGTSMNTFTMDKSLEHAWVRWYSDFSNKNKCHLKCCNTAVKKLYLLPRSIFVIL